MNSPGKTSLHVPLNRSIHRAAGTFSRKAAPGWLTVELVSWTAVPLRGTHMFCGHTHSLGPIRGPQQCLFSVDGIRGVHPSDGNLERGRLGRVRPREMSVPGNPHPLRPQGPRPASTAGGPGQSYHGRVGGSLPGVIV